MAGQVVHDDQVAGFQIRNEDLTDIGLEGGAVDRAIENVGRSETLEAQAGNQGRGLPVMGWTPPDGIDVPRWWC